MLEVAVTTDTETKEVVKQTLLELFHLLVLKVLCVIVHFLFCGTQISTLFLFQEVTHYLVKWCSLSYEEATWELQEDLDPEKIKEFEAVQKLPTEIRHMVRRKKE